MVGCSKSAETDFDPAFHTKALSTFAVVHKSKEGYDTLNDERIRNAITREIEKKGYSTAPEETADFHVTFQTRIDEDVPSNVSFGFGFGSYSSGLGTSVGTSHNPTDDKENLLINMVDPKTQKTFWRTSLSRDVQEFKTPEERSAYFDKTVAAMLKDFPAKNAADAQK
jgi:hypothetical protein